MYGREEVCTWLPSISEQHPENKTQRAPGTSSPGLRVPGCSRNSLSKGIVGYLFLLSLNLEALPAGITDAVKDEKIQR